MNKIKVRQANKKDLKSLINLLSQLTTVGNPTVESINKNIYDNIYVAYLTDDNNIIGTITLFVEDKIIHNGSKVGHIEDVVVDKNYRKLGAGKLLIDYVVNLSFRLKTPGHFTQ